MRHYVIICFVLIAISIAACQKTKNQRFINSEKAKNSQVDVRNIDFHVSPDQPPSSVMFELTTNKRNKAESLIRFIESNLNKYEINELYEESDFWKIKGRSVEMPMHRDSLVNHGLYLTQVGFKHDCILSNFMKLKSPDEVEFVNPETRPILMGCEEDEYPIRCSDSTLLAYIFKKLKYSEIEYDNSDKFVVEFIVSAEGNVENARIVHGILLAEQSNVMEVLESMPIWNPGKMFGRAVATKITFPLRVHFD